MCNNGISFEIHGFTAGDLYPVRKDLAWVRYILVSIDMIMTCPPCVLVLDDE